MRKKANPATRSGPGTLEILQLKVTLKHVQPAVWRRIAVANNLTLGDLHHVIQRAMGWNNDHMHAFYICGVEYAGHERAEFHGVLRDFDFLLHQVIKRPGQRFTYEYDFGDGWMHEIRVEKMVPVAGAPPAPRCLAGARACPPEDCGGPYGYQNLLAARSDPNDRNLERWGEPA